MSKHLIVYSLFVSACLASIGGCGGSGEEVPATLVPVKGKVLIDNEPIGGVSISFTPADGTKGTGGFGATDSTGAYSLKHRSGAVGIEPGEYKVVISRYAQPDGSPIPAGKSAADVGAVELLPASYSSVEETTLTATVPSKGTDAQDFQLSSR